jgi:hypothetical protein
LHVDQERRQVVREVVAERDRHDRDDVVAIYRCGAAAIRSERVTQPRRDHIGGAERDRRCKQAERVDGDEACAPGVLERVAACERDPPERARQPVERYSGERDEHERNAARRSAPRGDQRAAWNPEAQFAPRSRLQRREPRDHAKENRECFATIEPALLAVREHAGEREQGVREHGDREVLGIEWRRIHELEPRERQHQQHRRPVGEGFRVRPRRDADEHRREPVQRAPRIQHRPEISE